MRRLAPLLVLALAGCGTPPAAAPEASAPQAVSVIALRPTTLIRWTEAIGTLAARDEAVVANAGAAAVIASLSAEVGDTVTAGQVLAVLDNRDVGLRETQHAADLARAKAQIAQAEAQVAEAKAGHAQANQDLARAEGLAVSGLVAAETLDARRSSAASAAAREASATAAIAVAKAEAARLTAVAADLSLQRQRTRLVAPAAGLILTRSARLGATAAPGEPLFTLAVDGRLEVLAEVPETHLATIAPGQTATVRTDHAETTGTVRLVEPMVSPDRRSGTVRVSLENPPADLRRVGASVVLRLKTGQEEGLTAPLTAVRGQGADTAILIAEGTPPPAGGRFTASVRRLPVTLGLDDGHAVILRQGANEGQWLIALAPDLATAGGTCTAVPTGP